MATADKSLQSVMRSPSHMVKTMQNPSIDWEQEMLRLTAGKFALSLCCLHNFAICERDGGSPWVHSAKPCVRNPRNIHTCVAHDQNTAANKRPDSSRPLREEKYANNMHAQISTQHELATNTHSRDDKSHNAKRLGSNPQQTWEKEILQIDCRRVRLSSCWLSKILKTVARGAQGHHGDARP